MKVSTATLREIHAVLCRDRQLARLCTQNGWIDNDTLWFEVISGDRDTTELSVHFDEVITKGGGCVARRQPCWGRVRVSWRGREDRIQVL